MQYTARPRLQVNDADFIRSANEGNKTDKPQQQCAAPEMQFCVTTTKWLATTIPPTK